VSLLAVALIVSLPLGLAAQDEGYNADSYARLSYVNGAVYIERTAGLGYEKGEVNFALVQGDRIGTETGQAEIHFGHRNFLRLDNATKIELVLLPGEGEERIKLHLTAGSAFLRVGTLAVEKGIELHTPDASFYVLESGLYRFDVRPGGETRAFVREGSLEAAAEEGSVVVRYGETVTAADGRFLYDLIVRKGYTRVLEIGTSTGHSGVWEAWALSKTGGSLITIEIEEFRHLAAVRNFKASGLDGLIDARLGDARAIVDELDGPFDLIFLDADKNWTLNYFKALLPKLAPGGCFAVHGVNSLGYMKGIRDFLDHVRGLETMETTIENPAGGGISLSFKKKTPA
jgi:predicted O-methyltransferase YrrM